jgi:dipeptidyl aminopeptidase/acylaminoacyl peptidase
MKSVSRIFKKRFLSGILFMCLCTQSIIAQNTYTPELLWRLNRITEFQVSPDGKQVVYGLRNFSLSENKGNTDLWLVSVSGGNALKLTSTPESEFNPRWTADGKRIGFLKTSNGKVNLWEINSDGSGLIQVSDWADGADGFEYSPKGNFLLFYRKVKVGKTAKDLYPDLPKATGEIYDELMFRHWDHWSDGTYNHLFVQALKNGKTAGAETDLLSGEPYHAPVMPHGGLEHASWAADESKIAYACKKLNGTASALSTNTDIYLYDLNAGAARNISERNKGYDLEPAFSPDGRFLAWLSMETPGYEADKNRIMLYEVNTEQIRELTAQNDVSVEKMVWSKDGTSIYAQIPSMGTEQIAWISVKPASRQEEVKILSKGIHNLTAPQTVAFSPNILVCMRTTMSSPADLYLLDVNSGKETPLTNVNQELLSGIKTGKVESRMVRTTDNKDMLVWVIYPPDFDASKKYPALLYCQGGPQSQVSQFFSYRWNFQLMAARGYIVIAPNRRGLPGFGQSWNDEIGGDWGGQAFRDYLSATDSIAKLPFVDASRLGAVGASYGGYSVYWLAGNHQNRFKSFIAHCGVFNLESMYGATEEIFFVNREMEGPFWNTPRPRSYDAFSPHKFVGNWNTPMLVIHGDKDFRVPVTEGINAFSIAQVKGIPSRFLWFPDEGHWVMKPQNSVLWHRVFLDWLDKTLK